MKKIYIGSPKLNETMKISHNVPGKNCELINNITFHKKTLKG